MLFLKDRFERIPLRLHPNVAVVLEHLLRDVPRDVHDRLVAGTALGELRNEGVPVIMPSPRYPSLLTDAVPYRLERRYMAGRIGWLWRFLLKLIVCSLLLNYWVNPFPGASVGTVDTEGHSILVLAPRSDMTGADRTWAAHYSVDDVLNYPRGSKDIGIARQSYTRVVARQPRENLLTVLKEDGTTVTYDPARLYGVTVYHELEREFAVGDRLSFTAPSKELGVSNRDLGTVQRIDKDGQLSIKMDNGKVASFDAKQMRHIDHGYAVTSHSSQGLTAERVLVNLDSHIHADLINKRFAYVAVSRGSHDAHIYTDSAATLISKLSHDVTKSLALQVGRKLSPDQSAGLQI